jgi:acyl-CoA thioester hydrolase
MKVHHTTTQVRFAETDESGIVYYANYFIFFELGRVEMFRELGLPYDYRLPIVETYCRYLAPAKFGDLLEIRTSLEEVRSKGFRLGARIYRTTTDGSEPRLLAEGYTAMVTTDETGTPCPLPPEFRRAFEEG